MIYVVAAAAALVGAVLGGLLIKALDSDTFAFWPPPREKSWQEYAFWGLFRAYCALIVLAALVDPVSTGWEHWTRVALGLPVMLFFSALTVYGYSFLGFENTYGRRAGLVTGGIYAYSRNPQYIASVLASLGLALTLDSAVAVALTGGLFALYTLFAMNEEQWLTERYGDAYTNYCAEVPRFWDLTSWRRAREAILERL